MKFWKEEKSHMTGENSIHMESDHYGSVVEISPDGQGVRFTECCDDYFFRTMTKTEAIEALQEAIRWIVENMEEI